VNYITLQLCSETFEIVRVYMYMYLMEWVYPYFISALKLLVPTIWKKLRCTLRSHGENFKFSSMAAR